MPIWRGSGPLVKLRPKPGTNWLRYAPQRFFCRSCGVELRSVLLPLGYLSTLLTALLTAGLGFLFLQRDLAHTFRRYTVALALIYMLLCIALCLIQLRWGTTFKLPPKETPDEGHAL
jgi:hypothetical protein